MRHLKLRGKLGVEPSHREAMLRNLALSLFRHEHIQTTMGRAKQLRRFADHLIEVGKRDDLIAKKEVRRSIHDKEIFEKLFTVISPRFKDRHGGYTRIWRIGTRRGDGAELGLIEILPEAKNENEPRIFPSKKHLPHLTEEQRKKLLEEKKAKKQAKKEDKHRRKEELRARAEARNAKQAGDFTHSHKSQGRKTEKGTGRSKISKKGLT